MNVEYYREQLKAKEDMLEMTTRFLNQAQKSSEEKNTILSNTYNEIIDSINFAKFIQTSLLPDVQILKIFFNDADYVVKQQFGVGGDAIFIKNINQGVVFGLLDSTGHGVPGAILSVAGNLIMNEITATMEVDSPLDLTRLLNYRFINTFKRSEHSIAHMEGSIFCYSSKLQKLSYCSAKGKAYLLKANGKMIKLSNTKKSIGEDINSVFENIEINITKNDKLFLYSDGLVDQFGGLQNKKYTTKRLEELLLQNINKNVPELMEIVVSEHEVWKNNAAQTDDVSFMLIKF